MAGVERHVPSLVPVEEIGVLLEALWELVEAESVEYGRVRKVGLSDK